MPSLRRRGGNGERRSRAHGVARSHGAYYSIFTTTTIPPLGSDPGCGNGKIYWVSEKEGKAMGNNAFLLAHPLYKSPTKDVPDDKISDIHGTRHREC